MKTQYPKTYGISLKQCSEENFIYKCLNLKKKESSQISNLTLHFKKLQKEKTKTKASVSKDSKKKTTAKWQ